MAEPLITVVTPTYNRRDSLLVTLEGLSRQSLSTSLWEAVVVSDGSTDGTEAFLRETETQWPFRMRPVFQENGGPARARNRGIREAQGKIIVFLDDDVEPHRDFLARHALHHEKDDKIAIVGPMLPDPASRKNEPVWIAWEHAMMMRQYENFQDGTWPGTGPNHFYSGNASVRRDHLLAVNGFDETFKRQEDVEMAERLERERNMHFRFDYQAQGLHRPTRTFAGWLNVPYSYGQLDVERVQRGGTDSWLLWNAYNNRNKMTRLLMDISLGCPALSAPLRGVFVQLAKAAYGARRDSAAIALLSAVYNNRYLEGACLKMGETSLRELIREPASRFIAPSVEGI